MDGYVRRDFVLFCKFDMIFFLIFVDVGVSVYFYEFQYRFYCLKDIKSVFVKADYFDEIRFVFGGVFLKGDVVMFGKELVLAVFVFVEI